MNYTKDTLSGSPRMIVKQYDHNYINDDPKKENKKKQELKSTEKITKMYTQDTLCGSPRIISNKSIEQNNSIVSRKILFDKITSRELIDNAEGIDKAFSSENISDWDGSRADSYS